MSFAAFSVLGPAIADVMPAYVVALDLAGHGCSFHRAPGASYVVADYLLDACTYGAHRMKQLGYLYSKLLLFV
jgi:hypothetical protein